MCHEDYAECSRIERYTATMFARLNARILACVILPFTHTWKTLALTHHFTKWGVGGSVDPIKLV